MTRRSFIWQFPAVVDRIIDGDSVECHVQWKADEEGHGVNIRIEGVNAIELSQQFGSEARDALQELLPQGTQITLLHRKSDKYSGRFLARPIRVSDGLDISTAMLVKMASDGTTHLAVPYNP